MSDSLSVEGQHGPHSLLLLRMQPHFADDLPIKRGNKLILVSNNSPVEGSNIRIKLFKEHGARETTVKGKDVLEEDLSGEFVKHANVGNGFVGALYLIHHSCIPCRYCKYGK